MDHYEKFGDDITLMEATLTTAPPGTFTPEEIEDMLAFAKHAREVNKAMKAFRTEADRVHLDQLVELLDSSSFQEFLGLPSFDPNEECEGDCCDRD